MDGDYGKKRRKTGYTVDTTVAVSVRKARKVRRSFLFRIKNCARLLLELSFKIGLFSQSTANDNHLLRQTYILKLFIVIDKLDGFKRFLVTVQLLEKPSAVDRIRHSKIRRYNALIFAGILSY